MHPFELKIPNTFHYQTLDEIDYDARKRGLDIPFSRDLSPLAVKPAVHTRAGDIVLSNSLSVHPMEGFDADETGAPSALTERRYLRFAHSGAALIWSEAIAVCPEGRTSDRQLMITEENKEKFRAMIAEVKKVTGAPLIAQLTHSGRFSHNSATPYPLIATHSKPIEEYRPLPDGTPLLTDEYLDSLPEKYLAAAKLLIWAGFDGVDIKACHQYLLGELLSAYTREGKYGGSFENRSRLMLDITKLIAENTDKSVILASRLGICDMIAKPYGFGMADDGQTPDFTEANELIGKLSALGVSLIDMTMGSPYFNPYINRPQNKGERIPPEHPLVGVDRLIHGAEAIQKANPSVAVVGTGYSYLREFAPYAAAGALERGYSTLVGFGRMAFAYDRFADDFISGNTDKSKVCLACSKCTEIMRAGGTTGCPLRDQEIYLPIYRRLCMKK